MDKNVTKIILVYEDETTSEINKGFVASVEPVEGEDSETITFTMVRMGGHDLKAIIGSVLELAGQMGMFDDN